MVFDMSNLYEINYFVNQFFFEYPGKETVRENFRLNRRSNKISVKWIADAMLMFGPELVVIVFFLLNYKLSHG